MLSSTILLLAFSAFASAEVHKIDVGAGGALEFSPEAIFANPGDEVVFTFRAKNHTVTQSSFADPCALAPNGFDSGFQPVAMGATDLPTYSITVTDTKPIWVFCRQAAATPNSHCGAGMVFAVNCGADGAPNSFTNFKNSALAEGTALKAAASSAAPAAAPANTDSGYGGAYGGGSGGGGYGGAGAATTDVAYPDVTLPAAPNVNTVTATVAVESSTWTTVYGSYPNSPAPTPASLDGTVHKVVVGGSSQLTFSPSNVVAAPRDIIEFEFQSKNHTVTQSSFSAPCRKLEFTSPTGQVGFDSGFMPVAAGATSFPTFRITVNDTAPIWAYCRQTTPVSHCGMGMTFSVNADESSPRNSSAFQALAKQLNGTSSATPGAAPGGTAPAGGAASGASFSARPAGLALGLIALGAATLL